jgi:hypothetical protein
MGPERVSKKAALEPPPMKSSRQPATNSSTSSNRVDTRSQGGPLNKSGKRNDKRSLENTNSPVAEDGATSKRLKTQGI